ncbi:hypothetical protein BCR42DRAFT_183509 [Absidia repens]|uniref:Uncharacterized protein n=1 Tax=Absidia repens TaxID=90262 RepID=A0A1X2HZ64_9FUNG|nr:hypothetical protein BCR42DRAFT_183509 [Absidia repens]
MGSSSLQQFSQQTCQTVTNMTLPVCQGRGKSYCLIHRRYFETSWCPDCRGRALSKPQY